jgi:excisionase family DNA binding protein
LKKASKKKRLQSEVMYTSVEAAELLGVTARTIQIWADNGVLQARKTSGGHRRFPESVLEAFIRETNRQTGATPGKRRAAKPGRYQILIAEDESFLRNIYEATLSAWDLPIDVVTARDGYDTLIRFGILAPDMLIADLKMPKIDGFQLIRAIVDSGHSPNTDIVVLTGLSDEEIEAQGGLPERVIVLHKPAPYQQLQELISSRIQHRQSASA